MTELECLVSVTENILEIKSPSVGEVFLNIINNQQLVSNQIIGILKRLGANFNLVLPSNIQGTSVLSHDLLDHAPVSYAQTLFQLRDNQIINKIHESKNNFGHEKITSPMDGMFYLNPSPSDAPYVKIGQEITPGQTLGLIEVMKSFYPFLYTGHARAQGININIKNATPVTCGLEIFQIKTIQTHCY